MTEIPLSTGRTAEVAVVFVEENGDGWTSPHEMAHYEIEDAWPADLTDAEMEEVDQFIQHEVRA